MTSAPCLSDYNGPKPKNLFTFKLLLPGIVTWWENLPRTKPKGCFDVSGYFILFSEREHHRDDPVYELSGDLPAGRAGNTAHGAQATCALALPHGAENTIVEERVTSFPEWPPSLFLLSIHNKASQSMVTNVSFILTGLSQKGSPLWQGHSDYSQAGRRVIQLSPLPPQSLIPSPTVLV